MPASPNSSTPNGNGSAAPKPPSEWTVLSMLEWATSYLEQKQVASPRLSIEWLLAEVLGCKRLDLYLKFDRPLSPEELSEVKPLLLRRARHEPLQYITGSTDFFGLIMHTRPGALIPRPETEQMVEQILQNHDETPRRVLDLGTGTGCIPLALKHQRPEWSVCGTDISPKALALAAENAERLQLDVSFTEHDFFESEWTAAEMAAPFDIIVSNPPYIPQSEREHIEEQVKSYEPDIALFYPDIAQVYRAIASFAKKNLAAEGHLYVEIHEELSEVLLDVFSQAGFSQQLMHDYSGKPRFIHISNI